MEEMRKPELRFEGFTEDWNERELSLLAEFRKGQGYSKNDLKATGAPIILYGRLYTNYQTVIDEVDTYTDAQENSYYSYGGEVIVPASGETQEDIVRASVVAKSNIILGGDLNIVKPNESIDSNFLALTISNGRVYRELVKKAQGKSVVHIRNGDLKEAIIPYPRKVEQQQIGSFFKNIDELITKHQKKHKRLVTLKKSMLEKMFPKEGQTVPEIRFKGFEGDWKEIELNKVCWFQEGPGLRHWQFTTSGIKVINVTNLVNGVLNLEKTDRHISLIEFQKMYKHFEIQETDIVVASSGNSYGKVSVVRSCDLPLMMNTSVIRFKPLSNLDYKYLLTFLTSEYFKNQIDLLITGGAQPNFGPVHLNEVKINTPPTKNEQSKIGSYFQTLEELISNHQNQLQKLKNFKQSLSEKMFV